MQACQKAQSFCFWKIEPSGAWLTISSHISNSQPARGIDIIHQSAAWLRTIDHDAWAMTMRLIIKIVFIKTCFYTFCELWFTETCICKIYFMHLFSKCGSLDSWFFRFWEIPWVNYNGSLPHPWDILSEIHSRKRWFHRLLFCLPQEIRPSAHMNER